MNTNEKKNDGGPAFPTEYTEPGEMRGSAPRHFQFKGMSLRDWFAGQALVGYRAHPANDTLAHAVQNVAAYCYGIADAMLKAREQ